MHYDVGMIEDFLEHLRLELQLAIEHHRAEGESTAETLTTDSELVAQLAKLGRKYDAALLPRIRLDADGASPAEERAARESLARLLSSRRTRQLRHLRSLEGLLKEALQCAQQSASEKFPEKRIAVKDLAAKKEEDRESDRQSR